MKPKERTSPASSKLAQRKQDALKRLTWEIISINFSIEKLHRIRARALNISGPQWKILLAISDHEDANDGIPVNVVAKTLHVDASFVTTQSKKLENMGFLSRKPCPADARVMRLALSKASVQQLASVAEQEIALSEFIFQDFCEKELSEFSIKLASIKKRLDKARLKLALEF